MAYSNTSGPVRTRHVDPGELKRGTGRQAPAGRKPAAAGQQRRASGATRAKAGGSRSAKASIPP